MWSNNALKVSYLENKVSKAKDNKDSKEKGKCY